MDGKPGPGEYQINRSIVQGGGVKFSLSSAHQRNDSLPGPGEYRMEEYTSAIDKKKGVKISKLSRNQNDKNDIPGPGSYTVKDPKENKGNYSIGKAGIHGEVSKPQGSGVEYYDIPATVPDWPKYQIPDKKADKQKKKE